MSSWRSPVEGAHAFAVAGRHVLFAGGYKRDRSLTLVSLGAKGSAQVVSRFELRDGDDCLISTERAVGRAESLHVLSDGVVHRVTVQDAVAATRRLD